MRRDLNTCSRQSAMHHVVRVRVFFRRSSEHHSRNDRSSSSSTSWSHDVHVFSHIRTRYFSEGSAQQHSSPCSFHKRLGRKRKNTEQEQPAVRSAVAAAAAAAAEVRFNMTCRFVDGQGKRGNEHIPAIMSVAFPGVVVFDGFI